jgi:hypothetical protein
MNSTPTEYTIWDGVTPKAITSSTDATPIVVTSTAHGFSTGDKVVIYGHTTNVAANGVYEVTRLTADTFSLQDRNTHANIAGSGAGAGGGDGIIMPAKIVAATDWNNIAFTLDTSSSANLTIKFAGSNGKLLANQDNHGDTPNFYATVSDINTYSFLDFVYLDGAGAIIDGDTGVVLTGSDKHTNIELNVNQMKYVCPMVTTYTAGVVSLKCRLTQS